MQQQTVEHVPALQIRKEAVEVVLAPTGRGQHWIGEQIVVCFVPQEHVQRQNNEFLVDVPVPQVVEVTGWSRRLCHRGRSLFFHQLMQGSESVFEDREPVLQRWKFGCAGYRE